MGIFDTDFFNEDEEMLEEGFCKRKKSKKEKDLDDEMVEDELVDVKSEAMDYFNFDEDDTIYSESISDLKRKMQEKSADRKEKKAQKREEAAKANRDAWADMDEEKMSEKEKKVRDKDIAKTDSKAEKARAKADAAKSKLQSEDTFFDLEDDSEIYFESLEGDQLITEALLEDYGVTLTEDEVLELVSEQLLSERSVVRLDKQAKRSLAEKKAVIVIAKEQNDPEYKKLVKVYKQKRDIINKLVDKYGSRAASRVRKNKQSAGSVLSKFIKKGDSKQSTDMPQK